MELCLTLRVRYVFQGFQQLFQVLLIGRIHAGVTCRVNSRSAAQGIDRQPGIIRNGRKTGNLRRVTRFQDRIFDKCQAGLFRRIHAQLGLRDHVQTKII
ncbi:hypothetical protein D3C87_1425870 [compost metagenome]